MGKGRLGWERGGKGGGRGEKVEKGEVGVARGSTYLRGEKRREDGERGGRGEGGG